ncbi:MAG: LytR C-terminal domain-containing protein [Clostridium sp.]|nr:LytR C-terminal domain-containing protein [Clostridium sp.]MCM1399207.1 LytR C-terminal domain-containing protein [Clostridium sp.]MCM1459229.1 LytR C-terminal domain-containing protein [Bacteroides sp.]
MKKQSPVGLFFSILLRAVVIILGVAIIAFGIFFLSKVAKDGKKKKDEPVTTVDNHVITEAEGHDDLIINPEEDTSEDTEEPEAVSESFDKSILVLNSTNTTGLAGRWCGRLNEYGYANTEAADYSDTQEHTRIVAREEGVGKDLLQYFDNATYEVGVVTEGTAASVDGKDIVIIIGTADDDGQ